MLEKTLTSKTLYEGKIVKLELHEVELADGTRARREVVKHPGAVAILAVDQSQRLVLVEQFRKPLERIIFEIPAGKLETGEEPLACARRELKEETGYTAQSFTHLASFYTSPGFADELLHLFWAEGLQPGEAQPDQDEWVRLHHASLDEAWAMIADGRIKDAKTVLAVYAWQNHLLKEKLK